MKNKESGKTLNWNYSAVSIIILAVLSLMVLYMPNFRVVDENILNSTRLALSPYPSYIPVTISSFGYASVMMWPQIAAVCVLLSHRYFINAVLLPVFVYGSFYLCQLMKNFVCRERPMGCDYQGFSFPSCHAAISTAFFGIIIYLIQRHVRNDAWRICLTIFFGIWLFLIYISRMWLGVHFLSDIIAGASLGFLMVNLYIIITKSLAN